MLTIALIITTYNRPDKVKSLLSQLLSIKRYVGEIIIVDSSEVPIHKELNGLNIKYVYSSHKNQPYQRYLGYLASKAEILIFLDDDMEVLDNEFIKKVYELFKAENITGIALKFENKYKTSSLTVIPESKFSSSTGKLQKIKRFLTGYPELSDGRFGLCGIRGMQPPGGGPTEWVSGGAFAARRSAIFQNFNFQLFDIFEQGLGMGEDAIIGYGLSKQGKLIYYDKLMFFHNDQKDSTYTINIEAFAKRVAFSRLYLSLEKCRLDNRSMIIARLHYHYYMLWRFVGLVLNYLINVNEVRLQMLKGTFKGWILATKFKFARHNERFKYWHDEALKDLSALR